MSCAFPINRFLRLPHDKRPGNWRIALLKVLLPLVVIGASIVTLTVLQLNGTLREFLDHQSMFGMIAVVLILNIVGFAFIYMLVMIWNSIRHDLRRDGDR
jgi:formate/nitrite transporter FocA (FNT family)